MNAAVESAASDQDQAADRRLPGTIRAEPGWWLKCPAPGCGRLRRGVGLGPFHRPRRQDRSGRGELDDPVDGGGQHRARQHRPLRRQRHEPPSGPPRPHGIHAADRVQGPVGAGDRDRRRSRRARGLRHGVPRSPRACRTTDGGRGGLARPVDGWPRDPTIPSTHSARRPPTRFRYHRRPSSSAARRWPAPAWRDGSRTAGPPSTTISRRICPPTSSHSRRAAGNVPISGSSSVPKAATG